MPRIALVQMTATDHLPTNLARMEDAVREAARGGAKLVLFPEMAYFMGTSEGNLAIVEHHDAVLSAFRRWAREGHLYLLPGTLREPVPGTIKRFWNTAHLLNGQGETVARYRKNFLFRAHLPGRVYDESASCEAGNEVVVATAEGIGKLGLNICFDLRFPEQFRAQRRAGAEFFLLPSAFTVPTGKAHWEPLLRARAIENQAFVLAPAQGGTMGNEAQAYGHSLAVDPWGKILCDGQETDGVLFVDCDPTAISRAASQVSAWECRRDDLFGAGDP